MTLIPCDTYPPEGKQWQFIHWSRHDKDAILAALNPSVVYQGKDGSYWIPIERNEDGSL